MENYENEPQLKKMQEEIKDLQSKYTTISGDVKTLKGGQTELQKNMGTIGSTLEKMNKSVEEIMDKLNSITDEQQKSAVERMVHKPGGFFAHCVKKPLRKLAVGTVGAVMCVGDFTAERLANAREGMEDIVAEANYKRKSKMQEEPAPAQA